MAEIHMRAQIPETDDEKKGREEKSSKPSFGCWQVVLSRALPMLLAFLVVPATQAVGVATAATFSYILAACLGRSWKCLSTRCLSMIFCFTLSCWFFVFFWPSFLTFASWNNGWIPGFRALQPGYQPEGCDTGKLVQEFVEGDFMKELDAVHWDAKAQRCDCRLPDNGAEQGRCKSSDSEDLPRFTVVSALIDVGRRDRAGCDYLRMFAPQLHRQVDLVFFGEAWALEVVQAVRTALNLSNRTRLRLLEAGDKPTAAQALWGAPASLAFHHHLGQMQAIAARKYFWHLLHLFKAGVSGKVVPHYAWVTNEKANFVVQAARENYFQNSQSDAGHSYFVWIDVGAGHGNLKATRHFCACNLAVPGTVTLFHQLRNKKELFEGAGADMSTKFEALPLGKLTISNYLSSYDFTHHFDEIIGTFWGGDLAGIELFWEHWNATFHRLMDAGAIDHDQGIICLVAASEPQWLRYITSNFYGVLHLC